MTMNMIRDIAGNNTFGLHFADYKYSATLTTGVEQTITVPGSSARFLAIFAPEPGDTVWIAKNETAAVPVGATFTLTTSESNPVARFVKAGDVLHFITGDVTSTIGVTLHAIS